MHCCLQYLRRTYQSCNKKGGAFYEFGGEGGTRFATVSSLKIRQKRGESNGSMRRQTPISNERRVGGTDFGS